MGLIGRVVEKNLGYKLNRGVIYGVADRVVYIQYEDGAREARSKFAIQCAEEIRDGEIRDELGLYLIAK